MKYLLLLILFGNSYLFAQVIDGGYLKTCSELSDMKAKVACTDSILLIDIKSGWGQIKDQIKSGNYIVTYTIKSDGDREVNKIISVPQKVELNSKPEQLLELVGKSLQKHEWVLPKDDNDKIKVNIGRSLKINTELL